MLSELAAHVGGEVRGEADVRIHGVAPLQEAEPGTISFVSDRKYCKHLGATRASAVILRPEDAPLCTVSALVVDNPHSAYAKIATLLNPLPPVQPGCHPSAVVDPSAELDPSAWVGPQCVVEAGAHIGTGVYLGPGCVVGAGAVIGPDSRLLARVTVCHDTLIGARVLIHPGAVIGSDGFGNANEDGVWIKVPQLGRVRIGNDVEIGANTTVDRGALGDTILEDGVKLDNQIQVAHNVVIGAHTAIAGCVGIAGSAKIGAHCAIAGGVGIVGHTEIADHVQITAMSLVTKSITEAGVYSSGTPLQPSGPWRRNFVRFKQLDEMAKTIKELEKRLEEFKTQG